MLDKQEAYTLHFIVLNPLWVAKRGVPDIEPAISLMCTKVTKSTVEDKPKLKSALKFLKHTINDNRVVEADNLCTRVDTEYGVHPDLKSHTSGGM